jgi:hypothetical protein
MGAGAHSLAADSTVVAFFYGRSGVAFLGSTPYVHRQAMRARPSSINQGHTFLEFMGG